MISPLKTDPSEFFPWRVIEQLRFVCVSVILEGGHPRTGPAAEARRVQRLDSAQGALQDEGFHSV